MSILPGTVNEGLYEKIRDQIAQILLLEIPVQGVNRGIQSLADLSRVYVERGSPAMQENLPLINVMFDKVEFDQDNLLSKNFVAEYTIHIYGSVKSSDSGDGDELSSKFVSTAARIVEGILSYGGYKRLGFPLPSAANNSEGVANRTVYEILNFNPEDTKDALPIYRSVVRLRVRGNQPELTDGVIELGGVDTQACLFDSNECYYYTAGVTPPNPSPAPNLATLTVNGEDFITVIAPSVTDIQVIDSNGDVVTPVISGTTLTIPDLGVSVNGTPEGDIAGSVTGLGINLSDSLGPVNPTNITVGSDTVDLVLPDTNPPAVGLPLQRTGAVTPYAPPYDDPSIQAGRETDFFTLQPGKTNIWGGAEKFTDTSGGQLYSDDIVVDNSTWDSENNTVLGYYRIPLTAAVWVTLVSNAGTLSVSTFTSGWRLTNRREWNNILKDETTAGAPGTNYAPFNILQGNYFWINGSRDATFKLAHLTNTFGTYTQTVLNGGNSYQGLACRTFTVTGTTLT